MDDKEAGFFLHFRRNMLAVAVIGLTVICLVGATGMASTLLLPQEYFLVVAGASIGILSFVSVMVIVTLERAHHRTEKQRLLLALAVDARKDACLITDPEGRTIYANSSFHQLIGSTLLSELTALERTFQNTPQWEQNYKRLQVAVKNNAMATATIAKSDDGDIKVYELTARPLPGWRNYTYWRIQDKTERTKHSAETDEKFGNLLDFLNQAPLGIFSVNAEGGFVYANQHFAQMLGTTAGRLTGDAIALHDILMARPSGARPFDILSSGATMQTTETLLRTMSGKPVAVAISHQLVFSGQEFQSSYSYVRNLEELQHWQKSLRVAENKFRRFFDESPVGIIVLDKAGHILSCNDAFARMLGRRSENLTQIDFADLLPEDHLAQWKSKIELAAANDAPRVDFETRLLNERDAQIYIRHIPAGGEEKEGFVLDCLDLTEQKNLELQFVQSQKMQAVGQLAGGIAHDFNNLLTAMIGFCDLLLLRHKPGDPSFGDIMQIRQNASRAANLVRQLLAFSRQQTLQPKLLDLTDVLSELSHLLRRLIGENIEFQVIHGRDLGFVYADLGQLEQVLVNLAVNARDAMIGNGKLTIKTSTRLLTEPLRKEPDIVPAGDWVVLEVSDTGTGISPHILPRIFDPFFSTKEVGQGTGLGLATVYGIVKQTGGYVLVDSALNQGTSFTLYLPRKIDVAPDVVAAAGKEETSVPDTTGAGTILLVEDEDPVRMFSARALRLKGYNVLEASGAEAAMEIFEREGDSINLMISDVVMPQIDGPTLYKELTKKRANLKVIFMSGYTEDRLREHLGLNIETHFLEKPFSLQQLAEKVKEALR